MSTQDVLMGLVVFLFVSAMLAFWGAVGNPAKWRRWYQRSTKLISEPERQAAAEYLRLRATEKESTAKGVEGRASVTLIEEIRRGARWLRGAAGIVEGVRLEALPAISDMTSLEARAWAAEQALHETQERLKKTEREILGLSADLTETARILQELQDSTGVVHPLGRALLNRPPGATPERAGTRMGNPSMAEDELAKLRIPQDFKQVERIRALAQVTEARPLTRPMVDAAVQRQAKLVQVAPQGTPSALFQRERERGKDRVQARAAAQAYITAFERSAPFKDFPEGDEPPVRMQFWELMRASWPRNAEGHPLALRCNPDPKQDDFELHAEGATAALRRMLPFAIRTELLELTREHTADVMDGLRHFSTGEWVWEDAERPAGQLPIPEDARERSRHLWADWEESDVARELLPWPGEDMPDSEPTPETD